MLQQLQRQRLFGAASDPADCTMKTAFVLSDPPGNDEAYPNEVSAGWVSRRSLDELCCDPSQP